jgi:hypothetical protein
VAGFAAFSTRHLGLLPWGFDESAGLGDGRHGLDVVGFGEVHGEVADGPLELEAPGAEAHARLRFPALDLGGISERVTGALGGRRGGEAMGIHEMDGEGLLRRPAAGTLRARDQAALRETYEAVVHQSG